VFEESLEYLRMAASTHIQVNLAEAF